MSIYTERFVTDDEGYCCPQPSIVNGKKAENIRRDSSKHYPNKDEAAELRKIMTETGLTEKEVRAEKKYRIQLSEAQKKGEKAKSTEIERFYKNLIKSACKKTGKVPQHPDTIAVIDEIIKERSGQSWGRRWYLLEHLTTGASVVKNYAKK
jgi:dihydroxyacid dehydratase/phosphogluconate dehydratase